MAEQNSSEEVDLGYLFKRSSDVFRSIARGILEVLDFFKKYFIILLVLIIVGFGYGLYKDLTGTKSYNNELVVIPNFESVDYLYDKIEALNLKIASKDSVFLKEVFGSNYLSVKLIEIEPIADLYNFISKSRENIEILKIISQNQGFSEYVENMATSKYYKYHRMQVSIKGKDASNEIIDDLFVYFNTNEHFLEYQKIYKKAKDFQVQESYAMIAQLDSLIKANYTVKKEGTSVSVSNNSDQFNLLEKKRQILEEIQGFEIQKSDYSIPIKKVSANYNLQPKKLLNFSKKIKYPLYLVFLFSLVFFILYAFRNLRKFADSKE